MADARRYECQVCGYVYDEVLGDEAAGIPPGTPWESLPDGFTCPVCGAEKDDFDPES